MAEEDEKLVQAMVADFPIDDMVNLSRRETFHDIGVKFSNHARHEYDYPVGAPTRKRPGRGIWCYYVYINEQMLPADLFAEFWLAPTRHYERSSGHSEPMYNYDSPRWADADWHGGVTWYQKLGGLDGDLRSVEIGCDFNHSWDQHQWFTYDLVKREAERTVERLREMYPFYSRCCYTGRWQPRDQMIERDGRLYSKEGLEKQDEWARKHAAKASA